MIRRKCGEERGGWRSCEAREAYGVGLWKAISKMGHLVTPYFDFVVGDGKKVRFWKGFPFLICSSDFQRGLGK